MADQTIEEEGVNEKEKKQQLAQFYTTNYNYIFQGLLIPEGSPIVEPFVGTGLLRDWALQSGASQVETYDVDPKIECSEIRDTLLNPPDYNNKYVVTNPPFLARNKAKDKTLFELHGAGDLYKCFIKTLISGEVMGGVIITPLNFFCDERMTKVRDLFLSSYCVEKLNIFEETVFDDTTYTICSFQFRKSEQPLENQNIQATVFPSREDITLDVSKKYDWKVAGHLFEKVESKYKIGRLAYREVINNNGSKYHYVSAIDRSKATNIFIYAIDGGSDDGAIRMTLRDKYFYGIPTDRSFATLTIEPPISKSKQTEVISLFNRQLRELRDNYNSLFLTNFRNSTKSYARKRIGFAMAYNMVKKILNDIEGDVKTGKIVVNHGNS